jgi:hypothetical protein
VTHRASARAATCKEIVATVGAIALSACAQTPVDAAPSGDESSGSTGGGTDMEGAATEPAPGDDDGAGTSGGTGDEPPPPDEPEDDRFWITHAFGPVQMGAFEDDDSRCVSWTVDNVLPVYAQSVLVSNEGGFHHSNWFIVPEDAYAGPDGYWPCADRGYTEIDAATKGTVLFAQSTQSYVEEQTLSAGAVVKIPERSKIVAGLHTLNASPLTDESGLWLSLEPLHPEDVTAVVAPLSMQYKDLHIPAQTEARFTADCDLATPHAITTLGDPLWLRLHYILPHYHYLGNYFDVTVEGGELDGQSVFNLEGFNADANGLTFDPPLDLPGARGLRMTCGYDNWTSSEVQWGNGEGEMCVMLALVETEAIMGASVELGSSVVGTDGDVLLYEGLCLGVALPESADQGMPTPEEIAAPLYLPPVDPDDQGIPPIPECRDADADVLPSGDATLTRVRENVFATSCTYSSCHGMSAAAGLDLSGDDVHDVLMSHDVVAQTTSPLVVPGDPEASHLYQRLARCEPTDDAGNVLQHMPYNAPFLLDDGRVALVREWIAQGALDD